MVIFNTAGGPFYALLAFLGENSNKPFREANQGVFAPWLPGARVPETNGFIPADGDQKLSLRIDGEAADSMVVAC